MAKKVGIVDKKDHPKVLISAPPGLKPKAWIVDADGVPRQVEVTKHD